ncbi:MAG: hypothetical protein KTR19_13120 [Hyphomicrobiales bacterium]|nr:hypothetical protein [Hyphomicrobiales bacterium]
MRQQETFKEIALRPYIFVIAAFAAFCVYYGSSIILESRSANYHFSADTDFFSGLADGQIVERAARFHPLTVGLALFWMSVFKPLTSFIEESRILMAMFAGIGAAGVCAALWAFSAVVPRRYVLLCGIIYGSSLSIWYFSSIEESKILTATLSTLYIALYLNIRQNWSNTRAVLLTVTLFAACMNEIVSGFLVVIPAVDILLRRGWKFDELKWLVPHALVAPFALLLLELVVNGVVFTRGTSDEGGSHLKLLLYYMADSKWNLEQIYIFILKWVLFSFVAPTSTIVSYYNEGGFFEPTFLSYFTAAGPALLIIAVTIMVAACLVPGRGTTHSRHTPLLLALAAYSLLRGVFFFIWYSSEPLLQSAPVLSAHMLILLICFTASSFPYKHSLLSAFAAVLFVSNATFIIGPTQLSPTEYRYERHYSQQETLLRH